MLAPIASLRPPLHLGTAIVLLFIMGGCGGSGDTRRDRELSIFCAASLSEVFSALADEFAMRHRDLDIRLHGAGSQILAQQLIEGAPADLFAPAHPEHMDRLRRKGLVGEPVYFARNKLTIIVPRSNPGSVSGAADLARPGVEVILAGPSVPAGRYARETLDRMGLLGAVLDNLVSNEENVKLVLSKVLLGEADAGIVYVTDVRPPHLSKIVELPLPEESSVPVEYTIAVPKEAQNAEDARAFLRFILSREGQALLTEHGFQPVAEPVR